MKFLFSVLISGIVLALVLPAHSQSADKKPQEFPHIPAGHIIEILVYDPSSQTYAIADLKKEGPGPIYTTVKQLSENISDFDTEKALISPRSIQKKQYLLKSDLKIIFDADREKIAKFLSEKKKTKKGK